MKRKHLCNPWTTRWMWGGHETVTASFGRHFLNFSTKELQWQDSSGMP